MADNPKSPLRPEGEDLLQVSISTTPNTLVSHSSFLSLPQAALADPFSVPNLPRVSPFQPAPLGSTDTAPPEPSDPALSPTTTSPESSVSPAEFEAWKAEYDSQVVEWRRQSATVRARAEEERARWEERRAQEQRQEVLGDDGRHTHASIGSSSDWEAVSHRSSSTGAQTAALPAASAPAAEATPQVTSSSKKINFHARSPFTKHTVASRCAVVRAAQTRPRPRSGCGHGRLAELGKRAIVTHVFVSVHVIPGALASALPRAYSRSHRSATHGGCVSEPGSVRRYPAQPHASLGADHFSVRQYVPTICQRGDAWVR